MRHLFTTLLLVLLTAFPAFAQSGQEARLVGTVRDQSGGVVEGARITLSSIQLIGGTQTAISDATGGYRLAFLPPGEYKIVAEQDGFVAVRRTGIVLAPGLTFTVDFLLGVASVHDVLEVHGSSPVVDVRSSSSTTLIDRTLLEHLPLSRTVSDAVNLAPGVVRDVAFGGTALANPFSVDGASGTEPGYGTAAVYPSKNWFDELQIVAVGADAKYGEYSGALTNGILRSGSNRLSGLADFWTTRPNWTGDNRGGLTASLQERFRPIQIFERWDANAQAGGPLQKDRLWFFSGLETYHDEVLPTTFNGLTTSSATTLIDSRERKFITKLTAAISSRIRAEGFVEHGREHVNGVNASPLVTADALTTYSDVETMWNGRLLWTISDRAVLELRHGGHDVTFSTGPPADRRNGPPGHQDLQTGITSVSAAYFEDYSSRPLSTGADLTYFLPHSRAGRHEFKLGLEYEASRLRDVAGYVGGRLYFDVDGEPSQVEFWDGATYRPDHRRLTVYGQDSWTLGSRLTLNAGLRFGHYAGSVPEHPHAFSDHALAPRVGAAFDLTADHRTVIRAHYGRYHDAMVTSFYDFLDPLSQTPFIETSYVGTELVETSRSATGAQVTIDPHIRFPFVEEYLAGIERELPWGISGKAQYIHRSFENSIAYADPVRQWREVQAIDPGPDGRRGTADDLGPVTVFNFVDDATAPLLTNPSSAFRHYNAAQFIARKRQSAHLDFQASYTWSRTVGNYNNNSYSNAAAADLGIVGVFMNPNRAINTTGRTPQDFTHEFKILGTWLPGWAGLQVGGVYRYQSGRPWARNATGFGPLTGVNAIFMEPRATRFTPVVKALDLRAEKAFTLPAGSRISVFLDVFNVINEGVALRVNTQSGANFAVPTQWTDPRAVRAGLSWTF